MGLQGSLTRIPLANRSFFWLRSKNHVPASISNSCFNSCSSTPTKLENSSRMNLCCLDDNGWEMPFDQPLQFRWADPLFFANWFLWLVQGATVTNACSVEFHLGVSDLQSPMRMPFSQIMIYLVRGTGLLVPLNSLCRCPDYEWLELDRNCSGCCIYELMC